MQGFDDISISSEPHVISIVHSMKCACALPEYFSFDALMRL